jgi:hypothetical protein
MKRIWLPVVAAALGGCAASPERTRNLPDSWQPAESLSNCGSTDGRFEEVGAPSPMNAQAGTAFSIWPVMGSLSAMVRTGANGMPRGNVSAMSIEIVDGSPRFKAYGAEGALASLPVREWWCAEKALMTRAVLSGLPSEGAGLPEVRDESVLRLWRAQDGALIAEQTLESITPSALGSSSKHRALSRSYFRFPSEAPKPQS